MAVRLTPTDLVFLAARNLAGPEHAAGATSVAHQHLRVVIELPPWHEGRQIRAEFAEVEKWGTSVVTVSFGPQRSARVRTEGC